MCSLSGAADFSLPGNIAELRTERWAVVLRSLRGSSAGLYRGSACRMKKRGPGRLLTASSGQVWVYFSFSCSSLSMHFKSSFNPGKVLVFAALILLLWQPLRSGTSPRTCQSVYLSCSGHTMPLASQEPAPLFLNK